MGYNTRTMIINLLNLKKRLFAACMAVCFASLGFGESHEVLVRGEVALPKAYGASAYCTYKIKQRIIERSGSVPTLQVFQVSNSNYEPLGLNSATFKLTMKKESDSDWLITAVHSSSLPCVERIYVINQTN